MLRVIALLLSLASILQAADLVANGPFVQGSVRDVKTDAAGNRYVAGVFSGTLDFNPAVGLDLQTAISQDGFLTKFDSAGAYLWTQVLTGSTLDSVSTIELNAAGTVLYIAGQTNSADFGIGVPGGVTAASTDAFVVALLTSNGNADPSFSGDGIQTFGGAGAENGLDVLVDGSTIYLAGVFGSAAASLGGQGSFSAGTGLDQFVVAMDNTGTLLTGFNGTGLFYVGSPTTAATTSIQIALEGSTLYVGGQLPAGTDFGPAGGGILQSVGSASSYVFAINATTGAIIPGFGSNGVQQFDGTGQDGMLGIAASGGFVYATGFFDSTNASFNGVGSISRIGASFSSYVFCLNGTTGQPSAVFSGDGVQIFGGTTLSSQSNDVIVSGGVVYFTGDFQYSDGGLSTPGTAVANSGDAFIIALDATTGAGIPGFSGDGIMQFGGSGGDNGRALTASGSAIFWLGDSGSTDGQLDGAGTMFDATGFNSFLIALTPATAGGGSTITASPNPALTGKVVTFTATGTGPFTWDFGDTTGGSGSPVTHTYNVAVDTNFTVSLNGGAATLTQQILAPNTNAAGAPNIGNGKTVPNPLTTLSITVADSNGGVLELSINDTTVPRAIGDITTDFVDIPGRQSIVSGPRAVHKFTQPGIFVATARAKDGTVEKAKMRKTLALSSRETGASDALAAPSSADIAAFNLKGKFLFTKDTPDAVTFSGEITLPAGFNPKRADGNVLSVGIGNVVDTVTISDKGKGGASGNGVVKKMSVKYPKLVKGATVTLGGEKAKVSAQLSVANLDVAGFDTEGITSALRADEAGQKSVKRMIQIALVIGGVSYETVAPVDYKLSKKADAGQISGRASKP